MEVKPFDPNVYRSLAESGASAPLVYRRVRTDGYAKIQAIKAIRQLFSLSFEEADRVAADADRIAGTSDRSLPSIQSHEELIQVLRTVLGYCGCAAYNDAIKLLRDVLRCARDWSDALEGNSTDGCGKATDAMLAALNADIVPGLATWFLYLLEDRNLVGHAGNLFNGCWIELKGRQLLEAIESFYSKGNDSAT